MPAVNGKSSEGKVPGVKGENSSGPDGVGVRGEGGTGVQGEGIVVGVQGTILTPGASLTVGVKGEGGSGMDAPGGGGISTPISIAIGVQGISSDSDGCGVEGINEPGIGIRGRGGVGVQGEGIAVGVQGTGTGTGVKAVSKDGIGLAAYSTTNEAIHAESSTTGGVIAAYNLNAGGKGFAIFAKKEGPEGHAGFFTGNVWISGELGVGKDITLANADCAEDFNIGNDVTVEAGTVMVLGEEDALFPSQQAYDKRVAGVISGAGDYKPGIVLDKQQSPHKRQSVALLGKVYCRVDAQYASIEVGDLLTTSATPGHAMKAGDPLQAFGAVIGKALRPLKDGQGLIPILIALQ